MSPGSETGEENPILRDEMVQQEPENILHIILMGRFATEHVKRTACLHCISLQPRTFSLLTQSHGIGISPLYSTLLTQYSRIWVDNINERTSAKTAVQVWAN